MADFRAILEAIEEQGKAFDAFKSTSDDRLDRFESRIDGLQNRVEDSEAKAAKTGKAIKSEQPKPWRSFPTRSGEVIELPSHAKMADALPGGDAPVSFDRWLRATVAGDRCEDKDALDFAREQKQLVTTTSARSKPRACRSSRRWP